MISGLGPTWNVRDAFLRRRYAPPAKASFADHGCPQPLSAATGKPAGHAAELVGEAAEDFVRGIVDDAVMRDDHAGQIGRLGQALEVGGERLAVADQEEASDSAHP